MKSLTQAKLIRVLGLVQGVGFRPFVYRMATRYGLQGWVKNTNEGVLIKVSGADKEINLFLTALNSEAPLVSKVDSISQEKVEPENSEGFRIISSLNESSSITKVSPDIAVCEDCLNDLEKMPRRKLYPFINCTNCGPRFSIIKELPYDRPKTTMSKFKMCKDCKDEYQDITNRRFHAQPNACDLCGPKYSLIQGEKVSTEFNDIIDQIRRMIKDGKIIGLKGVGGMNIICDAKNEKTVERLRKIKLREAKPFAVMFQDINTLREYADLSKKEEELLLDYSRPIVLLKMIKKIGLSVASGLDTIGAILPYMPIHHILFKDEKIGPIVLTSGNIKDEPIIIDNQEAIDRLADKVDALCLYDRDIHNRNDDSIMFVVNNEPVLIRRSRGFAPDMIKLSTNVEGVFAAGAELKNSFCLGRDEHAIPSQYIGDLKNIETFNFYKESVDRFSMLFKFNASLVVHDKHPDYLSTKYALSLDCETLAVQHHVAHIASCMAENHVDETVIGVSFDGTGYGDDGNSWGGEFFVMDFEKYERVFHLDYIQMPGGDKAAKEPWRMAIAYLYKAYGSKYRDIKIPILKKYDNKTLNNIQSMIDSNLNCPLTSSMGRLFDAVSALLDICYDSQFEAEAPMKLESLIKPGIKTYYNVEIENKAINVLAMIRAIVGDIEAGISQGEISAKFHNSVLVMINKIVENIKEDTGIKKVALSGGLFQNRYILEHVISNLTATKFDVYSHRLVPTNDGGIALGQLAIGAKLRR